MSISPDCSETGTKKLNFTQTCHLLSQYIKEKGSFGDLSLGITCNTEGNSTRNFLQNVENSGDNGHNGRNIKFMDLFPQQNGFGPAAPVQELSKKSDFSYFDGNRGKIEAEPSQLTIFYGGKVIVFDKIPEEKANEIMALASKSSTFQNPLTYNQKNTSPEHSQRLPTHTNFSGLPGLPITRKDSLRKFFEKRKDRLNARAPYHSPNNSVPAESEVQLPRSKNSWLDINAAQSRNPFELQL